MARKTAKSQGAKTDPQTSAKPEADERVTVINLKGSAELRDWLAGFSKKTMIPAAAIARTGLVEAAKKLGYPEPPER